MKKSLLLMLTLVFMLSVVAACSSGGKQPTVSNSNEGSTSSNSEPKPGAQEPKKTVNLQFSIWGNDAHKAMYEELLVAFKEQQPHVNVEIITIPFADYQQKLSIMTASRTAPDVGWLAERMIPQFIDSKQLVDISANVKADTAYNFEDLFPSTLQLFTQDNALYGIPFSTPPSILFYNKTLFESKGLKTPLELVAEGKWDYEQFLKSAAAIADPSQGVYGVKLIREWKNWADALLPLFWSHGAELFNEDGTIFTLNSPEGQAAMQVYSDMIFKDRVHPKPGDTITFETGKIGMFTDRYSYVSTARSIEDFEWDIAPMPEGVNGRGTSMGYAGYSVFETEHPKEAMQLLKFLTSEASMAVTSQYFVPARKSILDSDIFKKAADKPSAESIQIAILDQMDTARVAPGHANWQQIDVSVQTLLDYLYTQSETAVSVLQRMEQDVSQLLK